MYAEILHCKMWEAERMKGGDHAGGEQPGHVHPGDHLSQAGDLGVGEEPV